MWSSNFALFGAALVGLFAVALCGAMLMYSARRKPFPPGATHTDYLERCERDKRYAYYERNLVICLLAKHVREYDLPGFRIGKGYDEHFKRWGNVLYIEHPELGQLCWHFHDEHKWMIEALDVSPYGKPWDGRPKEVKNEAIASWLTASA